ncbi:hypothetical protein F5544_25255 [Nocardia arthritidis]|uniref:Bacterial transcriptional activator domain-containing protein n=1 Tax=Nocardia arthritidis TaxID=228602 RepID=A0A6G9YIP4_9NOCA|nr:hypothetical protein F5544_25255 [Nocardia arthritidis]
MSVPQAISVPQVNILGPVLIIGAGSAVDRPLERAVLVRLTLAGGAPVPDRRLAADLWGDGELNRPIERLRVLVSRLRSALGPHRGAVQRTQAGYRTTLPVGDLRAAETAAERMYAARRAGQPAVVRAAADAALRLWRGPALADLLWAPFAAAEADRLAQWRLELAVAGLEAALCLGSGSELLREFGILAGEHPLHEPLARLHAAALYRAGSQLDALDRLRALRRGLTEQFGVEPAPETGELELRILRHDPTLRSPDEKASRAVVPIIRLGRGHPGRASVRQRGLRPPVGTAVR